jgi:hypothetical protein
MSRKPFSVFLFVLVSTLFLLLGFAAYAGSESRNGWAALGIAGALILFLLPLCLAHFDEVARLGRNRKVTVLIPNFRGKQWYATVEIDHTGRLLAPTDPRERVLSQANVAKEIDILRAPYFREYPNSIVMLGTNYYVPSIPFGE